MTEQFKDPWSDDIELSQLEVGPVINMSEVRCKLNGENSERNPIWITSLLNSSKYWIKTLFKFCLNFSVKSMKPD